MLVNIRAMAVPIKVTKTIEIRSTMATSRSEAFLRLVTNLVRLVTIVT